MVATIAGLAAAGAAFRPDRAVRVLSGFVSHTLCSNVFVSGLPPDTVYAEVVKPLPVVRFLSGAIRYRIDRTRREVRTTLAGTFESRAIFADGRGCSVALAPEPDEASSRAGTGQGETSGPPDLPPLTDSASVVEPTDAALKAALDRVFAEPDRAPPRWTRAIVVVRNGRLVAERYAPGYGVETPLLGFSVAKSVVNAFLGILVRQRQLSVEAPAAVPAWRAAEDPRRGITVDHLLRMTSGLALAETHTGFDPLSQMLFVEPDMAAYAERARLEVAPGQRFQYTGGNTLILSRIVRDAVGGRAEDVLRFARRELLGPLGMRGTTIEFDAAGTPVGSTYVLAPARDWARFGMLYLDEGMVNGRRILPEGWVRYSSAQTLDTPYGAGFWLGAHWGWPADSFFASGMLGQYIVVVPTERLVVVRFGISHHGSDDRAAVGRLLADLIAT